MGKKMYMVAVKKSWDFETESTQPAFNSTTNGFRIINFRLMRTLDWVRIPMCKRRFFRVQKKISVPFILEDARQRKLRTHF